MQTKKPRSTILKTESLAQTQEKMKRRIPAVMNGENNNERKNLRIHLI